MPASPCDERGGSTLYPACQVRGVSRSSAFAVCSATSWPQLTRAPFRYARMAARTRWRSSSAPYRSSGPPWRLSRCSPPAPALPVCRRAKLAQVTTSRFQRRYAAQIFAGCTFMIFALKPLAGYTNRQATSGASCTSLTIGALKRLRSISRGLVAHTEQENATIMASFEEALAANRPAPVGSRRTTRRATQRATVTPFTQESA